MDVELDLHTPGAMCVDAFSGRDSNESRDTFCSYICNLGSTYNTRLMVRNGTARHTVAHGVYLGKDLIDRGKRGARE
jgi:hypothetical protein